MRNAKTLLALCVLLAGCAPKMTRSLSLADGPRTIAPFDNDWQFIKADAPGAEQPAFNDVAWKSVDLPHDWSIEGPFDRKNRSGGAGAWLPDGVSWYRKHFSVPATAGERVFVDFDGVMANSDVWINGFHLGKRPYGYVSFRYELTGHLNLGNQNVLAVRTDNSQQPASRWYSGAGIYRHVRLTVTNPIHIDQNGTFVTTPQVAPDHATVHVQNVVVNQSSHPQQVAVTVTLFGPHSEMSGSSKSSPQTIPAGGSVTFEQNIPITPQLWDLEHPNLYQALCQVRSGNTILDDNAATFGVRQADFKADTGFWLNGKNIKLKGVCLHHEAGGFGAAVPLGAWEHRLAALKEIGCNAIRTAHNPPSPEFLDLCDRMGFLVMDEMFDCWTVGKEPYDYHLYFKEWSLIDTRDSVRRDRNHPSVILYSVGNEIHDTPKPAIAIPILKSLVTTCHENDPSRPVTQALFRPNVSHDYDNGLADLLDVVGTNYRYNELLAAHQAKPSRKIIGTENGPDLRQWAAVRDNPEYAGEFLWTGADYLGESRRWPTIHHESGLVDITDAPRPVGYQFEAWWSDRPNVHLARDEGTIATGNIPGEPQTRLKQSCDWNPRNAQPHVETVFVYSNCEEVELFLNGKSLGVKERAKNEAPRTWKVDFEPGELKAVGRNKGRVVANDTLRTAGKAARVVLSADHATMGSTRDDVTFITARVVDEKGVQVPSADDLVTFTVSGAADLAVVENTDTNDLESFRGNQRHAYRGRCVAILQGNGQSGDIQVGASAPGLAPSSSLIIHSRGK